MGFSDLISENVSDQTKLTKFSTIIKQSCNDLLDIISDILDIAKIESGQLPVNYEECNLNDLFAELSSFFAEYKKRFGKDNITFHLQADCKLSEAIVLTDRIKLKQIFINLIGNAFKFTDVGSIIGGYKYDNNKLVFYVSDTGIGIPVDKQRFVFERFSQLQQIKKNVGGTGLGLPIVKGLIDLLGGELTLASELGKGSTFTFSFPFKKMNLTHMETVVNEKPEAKKLDNKIILIVEDDYYNAEYLKEILSGNGFQILCAVNGREAVVMAITEPVDLVLMDVRLPDISGYEATIQIRLQKPELKIIAQTAYAAHDEIQKAFAVGCNDYISKPTRKDTLLAMLHKHLA
jgi:CheY-like chemotaxis protein